MAGRRTPRHGPRRRLRVSGHAVQIALGDRPAHCGYAMERLGVLRPEEPAGRDMKNSPTQKVRCAIYSRKSTEEGLSKDFNSLDAQREACEAYIVSQKALGWLL